MKVDATVSAVSTDVNVCCAHADLLRRRRRFNAEHLLRVMVFNRLCDPESKLGVWERWLSRVYLPSCQQLKPWSGSWRSARRCSG